MYYSGVLQGTHNSLQTFQSGFAEYLARTYSYKSGVTCWENSVAANAKTFLTNEINSWRSAKKDVIATGWTQAAPATADTKAASTNAANSRGSTASTAPAHGKTSSSQAHTASTSTITNKASASSGNITSKPSSANKTQNAVSGTGSSGKSAGNSGTKAEKGSSKDQSASDDTVHEKSSGIGGKITGAASKVASGVAGIFGRKNKPDNAKSEAGSKPGTESAKTETGAAKPKK